MANMDCLNISYLFTQIFVGIIFELAMKEKIVKNWLLVTVHTVWPSGKVLLF